MRALKAFVLGFFALGVVGYAIVAALAVAAQAGGHTLDVALGPLLVVSVTAERATMVTTFGPGLLVIALVGGILNLVAAQLLRQRHGRGPIA